MVWLLVGARGDVSPRHSLGAPAAEPCALLASEPCDLRGAGGVPASFSCRLMPLIRPKVVSAGRTVEPVLLRPMLPAFLPRRRGAVALETNSKALLRMLEGFPKEQIRPNEDSDQNEDSAQRDNHGCL
jgi:hypothetical protein